MSFRHKLQASRFELKYLIAERRTAAIRDFLRSYHVLDEYHRPECANRYQISSLYLDNPGLELYKQTVHGIKNRFTALPTPKMSTSWVSLQKIVDETYIGVITGDRPIDAFDQFVEDWKSQGGAQIITEVNDWWASRQ